MAHACVPPRPPPTDSERFQLPGSNMSILPMEVQLDRLQRQLGGPPAIPFTSNGIVYGRGLDEPRFGPLQRLQLFGASQIGSGMPTQAPVSLPILNNAAPARVGSPSSEYTTYRSFRPNTAPESTRSASALSVSAPSVSAPSVAGSPVSALSSPSRGSPRSTLPSPEPLAED